MEKRNKIFCPDLLAAHSRLYKVVTETEELIRNPSRISTKAKIQAWLDKLLNRSRESERRQYMLQIMPLRRAVVEITNEAIANEDAAIRKAIKAWHNRLATGSIPRRVIVKLGRELFLDLDAWEAWWAERLQKPSTVGRPRNDHFCQKF